MARLSGNSATLIHEVLLYTTEQEIRQIVIIGWPHRWARCQWKNLHATGRIQGPDTKNPPVHGKGTGGSGGQCVYLTG